MASREILNPPFLGELIETQARNRPLETALSFEGQEISYQALNERADRAASAFRNAGLEPGDRVAWLAQNLDVFWEALFGAAKSGVVLAPINWRLAPAEVNAILKDAEAKLFFAETQFLEPLNKLGDFDPPETIIIDGKGSKDFAAFRDAAPAGGIDYTPQADDPCIQLYTSGTTGLPKGVVLPHRCFYEVGEAGMKGEFLTDIADDETVVHALPHFHIAGVCYGLIGMSRSMPVRQYRQFDPVRIVEDAQEGPPLGSFLVPAMVLMILEAAKQLQKPLHNFRSISYGAAPMPEPLLDAAIAGFANAEIMQLYGMTETTGGVTILSAEDHEKGLKHRTSAGKPLPGCEVKVCGADGEEVPQGETGEIVVRSPFTMTGYWNRQDATDEVIKNGWYHTGDAGYLDENGFLYVVDRVKDMVISGGENIYPAEIESALAGHPNIREAAIIGVPDERWGEIVKAFVATRDGKELTVEEVNSFLEDKIAKFKLPRLVQTIDALPRNASGKILKTELRGR